MKIFGKVYKIYSENKLANDSFWALIGSVASRGLGLLSAIIVARFLGKGIYGEFGMIRNTLISIAIFSTFGLGYTATKYISEYKNTNIKKLRIFYRYSMFISLLVSGIMALLLIVFSSYISNTILEAPHLNKLLKYVAVWVVFNSLTTTQIGILAGFGEFKKMAKINTTIGVVTFVLSVFLTYFFDLEGALSALLLSQILNWYLNYKLVNNNIPINQPEKDDKRMLKEIVFFSFPIALQEGVYSLTSWISFLLLIKFNSYGELGIYTAAMQWSAVILFIPSILGNVFLSHLSADTSKDIFNAKILKQMLFVNLLCTIVPFVFVYLFSNFISLFYGNTFVGLSEVLKITVFTTIFMSLINVYSQAYMALSRNWIMLKLKLFKEGCVLLLLYYFLSTKIFNGGVAIAVSALIMNVFFFIIISYIYNKYFLKKC